jgi:glycerophosphoryl diester phosphodiesterase
MRDLVLSFAEKAVDMVLGLATYPESQNQRPPVIAHRGAWDSPNCPENTLAAFNRAKALGIWGIEFDIHFTRDNVPVVNHDPGLLRGHEFDGTICTMDFQELRKSAPMVPSLKEVLALSGLKFFPEIKIPMTSGQLAILAEHFKHLKPHDDYYVLSLDPGLVREHASFPKTVWILVGQLQLGKLVEHSIANQLGGVAGHYLGMNRELIARLKAVGQKSGVGFIPNANLYRREWGRGVDFIFTNTASHFATSSSKG